MGHAGPVVSPQRSLPVPFLAPSPSASAGARPRLAAPAALLAALFGLLTIFSGGMVLFGPAAARQAAGHYIPFVVWFNFIAGFFYILAAWGLWRWRPWAGRLAGLIGLATLAVFAFAGLRIAGGAAHEGRTIAAMSLRSLLWLTLAASIYAVRRRR